MRNSLTYSLILHAATILFAYFGLPRMYEDSKPETVIAVDVVKESSITNLKNQKITIDEKNNTLDNSSAIKNTKQITSDQAKKDASQKPLENKQTPINSIAPPLEKKKDVKAEVEKVKNNANKNVDHRKQVDLNQLDNLLKDLEKTPEYNPDKENKKNRNAKATAQSSTNKTHDSTIPLSISEKDNIKTQIERKFVNPIVMEFNPGEVVIKLRLEMAPNGEIKEVIALGSSTYSRANVDVFLTLKESLIRASYMASPLQNLPPDKYHGISGWKEIELTFDAYFLMNN